MTDHQFKGTVEALFNGMDGVISSKTVVGEASTLGIRLSCRWLTYPSVLARARFPVTRRNRGAAESAVR